MSDVSLQAQQQQFANHLRKPSECEAPEGLEDRRMAIYRDLFFNNIENFISSAFPVFRSLFTEQEWLAFMRLFFAEHKANTPYFLEISEEFLSFLDNDQLAIHQRFPFAKELCHYEWLELALDVADAPGFTLDKTSVNPQGDLLAGSIILSPFMWAQAYAWPVHEIGPENIPSQVGELPSCLLVYRTDDFSIEFMQINPATLRLLELIEANEGQSGQAIIATLANELSQEVSPEFVEFALSALENFRSVGVVLGTTPL